jgi:hypothetical protein
MSGFKLATIRSAIKAQLEANLERQTNVYAYPVPRPVAPYVALVMDQVPDYEGTFGPDGVCMCRFRLVIDPGGADDSSVMRLDDFLSVGTGNGSSVIDALRSDQTFGGAISGFTYEPGEYDAVNVTAELILTFIAMKQGAEV